MWNTPSEDLTPMLSQYHTIKRQYPDCLLFFRLGDFYELFYEDAFIGSKELGIILTSRPAGKGKERIPMCGVPYHSAQSYIHKLVKKGYKIAICEQLESSDASKGIVKRDVIRVITPGTYFESDKSSCGLVSLLKVGKHFHCAYINLSVGDFICGKFNQEELREFILKFQPQELITGERPDLPVQVHTSLVDREFFQDGLEHLKRDFNIPNHRALGIEEHTLLACAGAYYYVKTTQKSFLPFVKKPKLYTSDGYLRIDYKTRRGLELLENSEGREDLSLFGVINRTLTGMGRRTLKFRILHPYADLRMIKKVQSAVDELCRRREILMGIRSLLEDMPDIERLITRISSGLSTPRDYVQLKRALFKVEELQRFMSSAGIESEYLRELLSSIQNPVDVAVEIDRVLVEDPPVHVKEGGLIKDHVHQELDKLRFIRDNVEKLLKDYQEKLREETGIQSLKIGYNKVMGYYIEVTKPNLKYVPSYFKRRQTLSGAERFTTDQLQALEEKILSATTRIKDLEYELFVELRNLVLSSLEPMAKASQTLGEIDYLCSLAQIALEKGWVRPEVVEEKVINIEEGVHPVISEFVKDYVPNLVYMDDENLLLVITGPNMAGKSSYIRQTALLCILAHMGSFVPARRARIGLISSIYSRIGSGDVLALGISTFMNEMLDVANILNNADERSLIILDEVGRGTSTYDGIAISWAIAEHILKHIRARTLLATHFLELTRLEKEFPQVKNYHMEVEKRGKEINFLYTLKRGSAESSFGINVAKMAGLPQSVIDRAYQVLEGFTLRQPDHTPYLEEVYRKSLQKEEEDMLRMLTQRIESVDLVNTTPLQAMLLLAELKELVKGERRLSP